MRLKHRSLFAIFLLNCITFSLYQIYWFFVTKTEMNILNSRENKVPFFLWFFIPIINIWWFYRFCKGMGAATKGRLNKWLAFFAPAIIGLIIGAGYSLTTTITLGSNYYNPTALFSYALSILVAILPILYYQSYLNKVSR
ncbi:DUF4234 domain-containing protein [Candidatus Saccharibacteria bacterium]|nr:DUF4234 domain-containing protein [Candidatus Saccharibacteria bacterium]